MADDEHVQRVAALFAEVAGEYDQHVPFFTAFGDALVAWTHVRAGEHVLDVGTGRGAVARRARGAGADVVALDITQEMLRLGRGARVRADARCLPVRDESFDAAIGAFSFHLLPDPVAGLREAARAVKRDTGRVVMAHGGSFGGASGEWDFWFETLARHAERGTLEATMPAPTPLPDATVAFEVAGLVDVRTESVDIAVPVASPRAFLDGELSHGARSLFDRFAPDVRQEVEAELLTHLDAMHRNGGITLRRAAWFTEGRRVT